MRLDIEDCLAQVESCFNLLVPRFDIPDIYSSAESQDSSLELSPPHRGTKEQDGEEEERKERKRKRTVSSAGSFVSLSSGEESEDDSGGKDEVHLGGAAPSLLHTDHMSEQEKADDGSNDKVGGEASLLRTDCTNKQEKVDELTAKDEEILRRLYAPSSTSTSTSGDDHNIVKLGKTVSTGSGKGKGKLLESDMTEEVGGRTLEDIGAASSDDSDSSSDVEWEDVPTSSRSHDQLLGGTAGDLLQEHGLTSRGFSIPITIELSTIPEVRETEDNSSIIATLQECKQLLSEKYLPTINKWMEVHMYIQYS